MIVEWIKPWGSHQPGDRSEVPRGVADIWMRRGIVRRVDQETDKMLRLKKRSSTRKRQVVTK